MKPGRSVVSVFYFLEVFPVALWGLYEELRPREVDAIVAKAPIAYLPWGALEWHSYQNPIGLDALKAHALCQKAAERTGGVVWPPVFAGYQTMKPHGRFRHTIEVPAETVMALANAYLDQCADEGFKLVVILMGHFGGEHVKALMHVADNWRAVRHPESDMQVWATPENQAPEEAPLPGDHAGAYETSLMLYLRPELVDLSQLPTEGDIIGAREVYGVSGEDPRGATAERGTELSAAIVDGLVRGVARRLGS